jgi:hypothetical protein
MAACTAPVNEFHEPHPGCPGYRATAAWVIQSALDTLERCRLQEPGRIDDEIANLRSDEPDLGHVAEILGLRYDAIVDAR